MGPVFVDTNVLVYRHDLANPVKQSRADEWYELLWRRRCGRLSFQVLQELYSTLTRKLKPGLDLPKARQVVRVLAAWHPVPIDVAILERAWLIEGRYSLSWWDALIVAAAQKCECPLLLTEDLQHGQKFGDLRIVDPFADPARMPAEILAAGHP
jgi:predicted nucleic acid-binding protein